MARINIEDCWWTDLRRSKLIKILGNEFLADAAAVRMWRLAQEFWKNGQGLIPIHVWEHFEFGSACIESGLALVRDGSVYVRGSSQYLDWVREKREIAKANASKGGKASVEARKKKNGNAQPVGGKGSKNRSGTEAEPKQNGTDPNASGSFSGSSSVSDSSSGRGEEPAPAFLAGAIPEFSSSKVLNAPLSRVPQDLQKVWVDQWHDVGWIVKTLEKTFTKRLASGAGEDEDWATTFTSWLWSERERPKQKSKTESEPMYAVTQEQAWDSFQAHLRAAGVDSFVKLLPGCKESH